MKKITTTIGIPAYHSGENIVLLLKTLLKQKQKFSKIEKIIVHVDASKDDTLKNAKSIKNKTIQVISSRKNIGFAKSLQTLISKNKSDVFIELNDDIRIDSESVIDNLVKPFKDKRLGLAAGNIVALPARNFIGRSIYASYLVFQPLRYGFKKGNSDLTCDGKILALSKDFAKTLNLKKGSFGNADIYLYYENLKQGRLYKFVKSAEVKFRLPETIADFKNQESRAILSRTLVKTKYPELFKTGHNFSKFVYIKSIMNVLKKYPLETIIFKMIVNRGLILGKNTSKWKLALTTKKLSFLLTDWGNLFEGM